MVNTGLIGRGYWGKILRSKLEVLSTLKFVVSGRDFEEYKGALSQIDWAFVATPNHTHQDIVERCLNEGVNVFCEKPLTSNREVSGRLYDLARERGLILYVDDVFWFRDESRDLSQAVGKGAPKKIRFEARKYGSFKDNLFNNAAYHDLCILFHLFGTLDFTDLHFAQNGEDRKEFAFTLGGLRAEFLYDRRYEGKDKKVVLDGNSFHYNSPRNDALGDMIGQVLSGEVDFQKNESMCLELERALERLIGA